MVESSFDSHRDDISFQILPLKKRKRVLELAQSSFIDIAVFHADL